MKTVEIPVWEKAYLTLDEAAAYFGIGTNKLREITNDRECKCVLFCGTKRLIKRSRMQDYLDRQYSI